MNNKLPRISVLLPVYNGSRFLAVAIDSILAQSFQDFELLILNDGSSDDSAVIAQGYTDPRIRYFEHENIGLAATLNKGASYAQGEFLFRQDQDDVSCKDRFSRQVSYLDAHPNVALLGTWSRVFVDGNPNVPDRYHRHPTDPATIALRSLFNSAFVHSSVAIRRSAFEAIGGYSCDSMRQPPEDFELWSRICREFQVANLPEVLLDYREVAGSMSRVLGQEFISCMIKITSENLTHCLKDSSYAKFANQLAAIYHLNGKASIQTDDGTQINRVMISGALAQISHALASYGDIHVVDYERELQLIGHQLKRNYWLSRIHYPMIHLAIKAIFRMLRKYHGPS